MNHIFSLYLLNFLAIMKISLLCGQNFVDSSRAAVG